MLRDLATGAAAAIATTAVLLIVVVLPVAMWGHNDSKEFFGAFFGSIVSAAAAVAAVIVSARQIAKTEQEKELRHRREQLGRIGRIAHAELIGAALGANRFGESVAAAIAKGATAEQYLKLVEVWRRTTATPTASQYALDLSNAGPTLATIISKCMQGRAAFESLLAVIEDRVKEGYVPTPNNWAALLKLCGPLPVTFFGAAREIKATVVQDASWADVDEETGKQISKEWEDFKASLKPTEKPN